MTADHPRKEKNHMTVFTIDAENNIHAFPDADPSEAAAGNGAQSVARQKNWRNWLPTGRRHAWSRPGTALPAWCRSII